jgi:manganese/zinc/iron transport system permease protein
MRPCYSNRSRWWKGETMDLGQILHDLFFDYTLRTVALGASTLGLVSGALGAFAVLRRQSLLGDAISHAALPGVVLAFLITRTKLPLVMMVGAAIAGWLATLWMISIVKNTRIKEDGALGLVLSVFFGFGLMLLTFTQRLPDSRQAGLDHFLFGQAAALLASDVVAMVLLGGLALLLLGLFWKEFKLLSFDREFGASLGIPMGMLDILLTTLLVVAIVIGLQAVGVVLMSAMLVAPAVAARQWTDRLSYMVLLSAFFGVLAGVSGAVISSVGRGFSTGPTVVLCAGVIVLISLLFAPSRGLVWNWIRQRRNRRRLHMEAVLRDLYYMAGQHPDSEHAHSTQALRAVSAGRGGVRVSLQALEQKGLVRQVSADQWAITSSGAGEAERLQREIGS